MFDPKTAQIFLQTFSSSLSLPPAWSAKSFSAEPRLLAALIVPRAFAALFVRARDTRLEWVVKDVL